MLRPVSRVQGVRGACWVGSGDAAAARGAPGGRENGALVSPPLLGPSNLPLVFLSQGLSPEGNWEPGKPGL